MGTNKDMHVSSNDVSSFGNMKPYWILIRNISKNNIQTNYNILTKFTVHINTAYIMCMFGQKCPQ